MDADAAPHPAIRTAVGRAVSRRGAASARRAAWGRALALLLLLAFGRAAVVPPCEAHGSPSHGAPESAMHGAAHGAATGDAHHAVPAGHGEQEAPHGDGCTCLGACHNAAAAAWLGSDAPLLLSAARAFRERPAPAGCPEAPSARPPHFLPFATAPPASGV